MQAVEKSQGLVHDIRTDLPGDDKSASSKVQVRGGGGVSCVPYRACQLLLQHQTAAAAAATCGLRHDGLRVGRSLGRSSCAGGIIVDSLPLSLEEQSELQV